MTTGTGPQALADYIESNWQTTRAGRNDVPALTTTNRSGRGDILLDFDRDEVAYNSNVHAGLIHCYHPEAAGLSRQDNGYKETNEVETVQVDIEVTDRTDAATGEREYAKTILTGDRDAAGFPSDESGPYPGVNGEFIYVLETGRRGLKEWDVSRMDPLTIYKGNSNASVKWNIELEHIAKNTVQ